MRTIAQTQNVTLKVTKDDLINDEWVPSTVVSNLLKVKEEQSNTTYKAIRNKFYNSLASGKYITKEVAGIKCLNIKDTMKNMSASLVITFEL